MPHIDPAQFVKKRPSVASTVTATAIPLTQQLELKTGNHYLERLHKPKVWMTLVLNVVITPLERLRTVTDLQVLKRVDATPYLEGQGGLICTIIRRSQALQ